jgi:hypothetical protein
MFNRSPSGTGAGRHGAARVTIQWPGGPAALAAPQPTILPGGARSFRTGVEFLYRVVYDFVAAK